MLVNAAAAHAARSAAGHSTQAVSGRASRIAGAPWAWKARTRYRRHWCGKAGIPGRGKRRRHSRWYRHIDRTRLHCRECGEGRSNCANCDDTNEGLHLVIAIFKQVACLRCYWHHHEECSQRLIQFDGEGTSSWLKKPHRSASHRRHRRDRSEIASRKTGDGTTYACRGPCSNFERRHRSRMTSANTGA